MRWLLVDEIEELVIDQHAVGKKTYQPTEETRPNCSTARTDLAACAGSACCRWPPHSRCCQT